jgi:hypothetical protein
MIAKLAEINAANSQIPNAITHLLLPTPSSFMLVFVLASHRDPNWPQMWVDHTISLGALRLTMTLTKCAKPTKQMGEQSASLSVGPMD